MKLTVYLGSNPNHETLKELAAHLATRREEPHRRTLRRSNGQQLELVWRPSTGVPGVERAVDVDEVCDEFGRVLNFFGGSQSVHSRVLLEDTLFMEPQLPFGGKEGIYYGEYIPSIRVVSSPMGGRSAVDVAIVAASPEAALRLYWGLRDGRPPRVGPVTWDWLPALLMDMRWEFPEPVLAS